MIERLLDLPGAIADALLGRAEAPALPEVTPAEAAVQVRESPRANAYLSLETDGVRRYRVGGHLFAIFQKGRVAFAVGGLHGPPAEASEALASLVGALRRSGCRRVLLVPLSVDELPLAHGAGFRCAQVATEALLRPAEFSLAGGARADLRQMCHRALRRSSLSVREVDPGGADGRRWLDLYRCWLELRPKGHEMRLLVGRPHLEAPLGRRYFAAFAPGRELPVAAISLSPGWGGRGVGVDIMARDPEGPAGAMELLLAETVALLAAEGCERFSLGSCPMVLGPDPVPHTARRVVWLERALYRSALGARLFGFRSLHLFKAKFSPEWSPVFLAGWPSMGLWAMYTSARLWGMFS